MRADCFHPVYMQEAKAQARLCISAVSLEHLVPENAISIKISCSVPCFFSIHIYRDHLDDPKDTSKSK